MLEGQAAGAGVVEFKKMLLGEQLRRPVGRLLY